MTMRSVKTNLCSGFTLEFISQTHKATNVFERAKIPSQICFNYLPQYFRPKVSNWTYLHLEYCIQNIRDALGKDVGEIGINETTMQLLRIFFCMVFSLAISSRYRQRILPLHAELWIENICCSHLIMHQLGVSLQIMLLFRMYRFHASLGC